MPRSIESIMRSHNAANERRAVGKSPWDRTVKITHLLSEDAGDEDANRIGKALALLLRNSSWMTYEKNESGRTFNVLEELCERFDDSLTLDDFNTTLDELYDLADEDRVWLGL